MNHKKFCAIAIVYLVLSLPSCISEYTGVIPTSEPQVVVSSLLSPDRPISLELRWSKIEDDDSSFKIIDRAVVRIWEDGALIIEDICERGNLNSTIYPKYGSKYELDISVPDYGEVTASTSIPASTPSGEIEFHETRHDVANNEYYQHIKLSGMDTNTPLRALWLVAKIGYEYSDKVFSPVYYYPNTYEIDQVNSYVNSLNSAYTGSSVECEGFIRIPEDIIKQKDYLNLSFIAQAWNMGLIPTVPSGEKDQYGPCYISTISIDIMAPSDEYDRYCRSVYKQYYFRYDPDTPFLNENVIIQGNITNGLGVFAGYAVHSTVFTGYKDYYLNNYTGDQQ
jgi:hypothetical protein